jgi:hypothetical protein
MRLNEFTDPRTYISTDTDAADFLRQIETTRPDSIGDDGAPLIFRPKQRPQNDRLKPLDAR